MVGNPLEEISKITVNPTCTILDSNPALLIQMSG
jgi:hypothetical protein